MESLHLVETEQGNQTSEILQAFFLYKQKVRAILQNRQAQGLPLNEDEFIPHPDHIDIDIRGMEVSIKGPVDEKDKRLWDKLWQTKKEYEGSLHALQSIKTTKKDHELVTSLIEKTLFYLQMYEQTILMRWDHPIENVVLDPKRHHHIQERIQKIQNGTLNFDGSVK